MCPRLGVRILSKAEYSFALNWSETEEEAQHPTMEEKGSAAGSDAHKRFVWIQGEEELIMGEGLCHCYQAFAISVHVHRFHISAAIYLLNLSKSFSRVVVSVKRMNLGREN